MENVIGAYRVYSIQKYNQDGRRTVKSWVQIVNAGQVGWKTSISKHISAELEQSFVFIPELASSYLQLIGILCWTVQLGRIDILVEVSMMLQY